MDPVMAKVGNCFAIWDILRGGNISINNLPRLTKYQDSTNGWSTRLIYFVDAHTRTVLSNLKEDMSHGMTLQMGLRMQ
jgi:hypothetical protein